jgi:acetoin utilization deacetylase AcuC-like enzyme
VHPASYLEALEAQSRAGGGLLDADTVVSADSWRAAVTAAGTGIAAIDALSTGAADAAFLAVRPPGHHARPAQGMGFCLLNNVAVAAAELAERGEKVLIVDYDAHHGNGTQEIFYDDPRVLYVSFHEWPLYPGTGRHDEIGAGAGEGTTVNLPLPAGATGDVYLRALDDVVAPQVERFAPTWVLISAGFDAHRADPLTGLGLSAGDFAAISDRVAAWAAPGRLISFLEGGYSLDALRDSVAASLPTLIGAPGNRVDGEGDTSGGPGTTVVEAVSDLWHRRATG